MVVRRGVRMVWRVALVALVAVLAYLTWNLYGVWHAGRTDDAVAADAIVVLGAAQWDGKPSPVLKARLDHAADLYEQGVAPVIVVTGGNQPGDRVTQGFAAYQYLKDLGVPESSLRVEVDGTNTYEELSASANILRAEGLGDEVVLVSDPYHMQRALLIADEVGLTPHGSPADTETSVESTVRETAAVSLGRLLSFRRMANWLS